MTQCIIITCGPYISESRSRIQRNLASYRIASSLENAGYSTAVIDFINYFSFEELLKSISIHLSKETLWVGFSSSFFWGNDNPTERQFLYPNFNLKYIDTLFDYIRSQSNAKIIYGGIRAARFIDQKIDCFILGYADNAVINYTKYVDTKKIGHINPSLVIGDTIIIDSKEYPEPAMNNIRTHWWRKDFNILNGEALPLELARGCIFKCKMCSYTLIGKKKGTYLRDIEEVRDDLIRTWESHGTTNYYLTDDTFNDDNDKIQALHKLFTSLPFKLNFTCYLRLDLIYRYPHQADMLLDMGLVGNFFGIETLNKQSGIAIGKGLHPNKVKDTLHWLKSKWQDNVNMGCGIIFGLPYDTPEYFAEVETWALEKDNPLSSIEIYPLMLHHSKTKDGYKLHSSEFSMNPEIYGYEIDEDNFWRLKSQGLDYGIVTDYANNLNRKRSPMNKVSEFQIMTQQNAGISISEVMSTTYDQLGSKFNMTKLNESRILEYKKMIGVI
jgi:radical SAM superfamily enzyme YgiQ (UPF0313 family)